MALFITSQFQAIIGVSIAALFLMKLQPNPFAGERGAGSMERGAGKRASVRPMEKETKRPKDTETNGDHSVAGGPPTYTVTTAGQVAADGGVVRTLPTIRTPKRIASWMPRRMRAAVVAAARSAEEETGDREQGTAEAQNGSGVTRERPRQVAVPYRNYRRYRG
jgi:hypothetical protein